MHLRYAHRALPFLAVVLALVAGFAPVLAQTPLDPTLIPKYAVPLPLPSALDGTATSPGSPLVITMSEFQQQILPPALYPPAFSAGTYLWGYNGTYPGPTIVAQRGIPTYVHYVNDLQNPGGGPLFLQNTIKVDQTLHWADPFHNHPQMTPYLGPVPAVVHLHGAEVPAAFDGGPDAWWTPDFMHFGPGYVSDTYVYPNEQEATTMFYHDHALGTTRLNVYAGLAGFYLLLDPAGEPADLPGGSADTPLDQYGHPYQVGLAIQDRMFDTDGQLYFPAEGINPEHPFWVPEFFGNVILVNGKPWPYFDVEPRRYRFRVVNGSNARFYRMQLVHPETGMPGPAIWQIGSDGGLLDAPARLSASADPEELKLTLAPGERADFIIDFAGFAGQELIVTNDANEPFPDGDPADVNATEIMQFRVGGSVTGGVDPSLDPAVTPTVRPTPIERFPAPPTKRALTLNENMGEGGPLEMFLNNTMWDMTPTENLRVGDTEVWEVINLTADTHPMHLHLFQFQMLDRQAFDVAAYESVYGMPMAGMGPPMDYELPTAATGFKLGGNPDVTPYLIGAPRPPDANETGWKDTFRMNPGEVTRIIVRVAPQDAAAKAAAHVPPLVVAPGVNLYGFEPWTPMGETDSFGYPGGPGYVWHCHIIDHEDNEMMRPMYILGPDNPTPALLALFEAEPGTGGVTVRWQLAGDDLPGLVKLERSEWQDGPWTTIPADPVQEGTATVVVDAGAVPGQSYWYRLVAVMSDGSTMVFGPVRSAAVAAPAFALSAVSPNPSAGAVSLQYTVAKDTEVSLTVLDVQGREVTTLARGKHAAGQYSATWDGAGQRGQAAAGVYFVRYRAAGLAFTQRFVLVR
jgi:spore coat protein A, manganese oxidase